MPSGAAPAAVESAHAPCGLLGLTRRSLRACGALAPLRLPTTCLGGSSPRGKGAIRGIPARRAGALFCRMACCRLAQPPRAAVLAAVAGKTNRPRSVLPAHSWMRQAAFGACLLGVRAALR